MMQKPRKRLLQLIQKYKNLGLGDSDYLYLDINKISIKKQIPWCNLIIIISVTIICFIGYFSLEYFDTSECLIEMPSDASKWFREPESCFMCKEVFRVDKIKNISSDDFYGNYFYKTRPVVVIDGAKNWTAMSAFSFEFFRDLYQQYGLSTRDKRCQFFPYKTEFNSLKEALNMEPARSKFLSGQKPWYIGWSNCNNDVGKVLRRYYDFPYFLPNISENIALNWIFMGGPGFGAHMHVDNVQYPSWQAQIRGRKLWRLAPPPECYYECKEIETIIEPGEIFVVDTNRWYHQTFVLPGDISITIGSEFD